MKSIAAAVVTLSLGGLLAGCAGGDDDPATASSTSSSSSTPTSSPTPTVAPATGARLTQPSATMNAPDGWKHLDDLVDFQDTAGAPKGADVLSLYEMPLGSGTLTEAAQNSRQNKSFKPPPERLADVELDGVPAYHLSGPIDRFSRIEEYGALYRGRVVTVEFQLTNGPAAERRALVDSALASFHWR